MGLFGKKKEKTENPYAQQPVDDYAKMTPYQRAKADLNNPRPPPTGGLPSGPGATRGSAAPSATSYSGSTFAGSTPPSHGDSGPQYGGQQGYGANQFSNLRSSTATAPAASSASAASAASAAAAAAAGRPRGYGGFESSEPDTSELYGGARTTGTNRYAARQQQQQTSEPTPNRYASATNSATAEDDDENDYTELTEEQREEREYRKIRLEQKNVRRDNVAIGGRSLDMLGQMKEIGIRTVARLGEQDERLHSAKQNMVAAEVHAERSKAHVKDLKHANRSMFAPSGKNPFTKNKRDAKRVDDIVAQNRAERNKLGAARLESHKANQLNENGFRQIHDASGMSKYDEGSDDEDPEMKELSQTEARQLDMMQSEMAIVNQVAKMKFGILQRQIGMIDELADKTENVTDGVVRSTAGLKPYYDK